MMNSNHLLHKLLVLDYFLSFQLLQIWSHLTLWWLVSFGPFDAYVERSYIVWKLPCCLSKTTSLQDILFLHLLLIVQVLIIICLHIVCLHVLLYLFEIHAVDWRNKLEESSLKLPYFAMPQELHDNLCYSPFFGKTSSIIYYFNL